MKTNPILRQIINRDCHVGMPYRQVIKHVVSRLKHGHQTYRSMPKAQRREMLRQCVSIHKANRAEYRAVMG